MKRYRIALDARRLARPSLEGVGQYVLNLAMHLPELAPEFEFILLANNRLNPERVPVGCRQVTLGRAVTEGGMRAKTYAPLWMNLHVARFLEKGGADLFHGTNYALPILGSCPCVATIHDVAFMRVPRTFSPIHRMYLRSQVRHSVRRADHIVVGSHAAGSDLAQMVGVSADRMTVIHHGVNESYCAFPDEGNLEHTRRRLVLPNRYVLYVGVIESKKNIEALLVACAPLLREGTIDAVVLAGRDGRSADRIRAFAAQLGFGERARFLGHVPQELMGGLYYMAQVFVFPSWFEGFGLPIVEAMACGTPVVASDASSLPEVAGGAALLFPPDQTSALEASIRSVLSNSRLRADLVRRGAARAAEFSWAASASRHLEVYRRVLEAGDRSGRPWRNS